jgi:hypothetical protein
LFPPPESSPRTKGAPLKPAFGLSGDVHIPSTLSSRPEGPRVFGGEDLAGGPSFRAFCERVGFRAWPLNPAFGFSGDVHIPSTLSSRPEGPRVLGGEERAGGPSFRASCERVGFRAWPLDPAFGFSGDVQIPSTLSSSRPEQIIAKAMIRGVESLP